MASKKRKLKTKVKSVKKPKMKKIIESDLENDTVSANSGTSTPESTDNAEVKEESNSTDEVTTKDLSAGKIAKVKKVKIKSFLLRSC